MGKKLFQARVVAGRYTLPAALALLLACRLLELWLQPVPADDGDGGGGTLWRRYASLLPPGMFAYWAGVVLHVAVGWMLIVLNNTFAIIRTRASFQTSVYLLLTAVLCPALYVPRAGDVGTVLFVVSLFFLFRSYRRPAPSADLFAASACLALGSLAVPQLLLLLPLYWIGTYTFQSLTPRSFCASLVGAWLPYWFLLAHAWWYGEMDLFAAPWHDLATFTPLCRGLDVRRLCLLGYLFLLCAVAAGRFFAKGYEDKIRTRCYLRFFILTAFCLLAFVVLQPSVGQTLVPLLTVCVSVLAGHLFVLSRGRAANVFFLFSLLGLLALFVLNLWMLS